MSPDDFLPPPGQDGEGQLLRPDTTGTDTTGNGGLDLEYKDREGEDEYFDYSPYAYEYGDEYEYYEYGNTRRKRQHRKGANQVELTLEAPRDQLSDEEEVSKLSHGSETLARGAAKTPTHIKKKPSRKRRKYDKNEPENNFRGQDRVASQTAHSLPGTDQQQEGGEPISRRREKNRRLENLHPLKTFGLRTKRRAEHSGKSSGEDVTWI